MSDYEEDFEAYADEDDDFEARTRRRRRRRRRCSDDAELEVGQLPPAAAAAAADEQEIGGLPASAWPGLAPAVAAPPPRRGRAGGFARALIPADGGDGGRAGPACAAGDADGAAAVVILSPAPPPALGDAERARACRALARSARAAQRRAAPLEVSPPLVTFAAAPLSTHEQLARGVGAFASRRGAACQTRQLGQDAQEADVQTGEVEQADGCCQAPDDTYAAPPRRPPARDQRGGAAGPGPAAAVQLQDRGAALAAFLGWAVPEALAELGRRAPGAAAAAAAGPAFAPCARRAASPRGGGTRPLLAGELPLAAPGGLLAGRAVLALACPPTPAAAAAAAAAVGAATGAAVSSDLLLACCSAVAMPPEAAIREHGLPGMACLAVWDLAAAAAPGGGLLQLLVCEGAPACCCWGAGAPGGWLVFAGARRCAAGSPAARPAKSPCLARARCWRAGMEEGGLCCWDLSEPGRTHQPLEAGPQQLALPLRRPSCSTGLPLLDAGDGAGSAGAAPGAWLSGAGDARIAALAALPPGSGGSACLLASGGAACQVVSLSAAGSVATYSAVLGSGTGELGLGTRAGSRVSLVRTFEGVPLGVEAAKPLHLRSRQPLRASSLALLPGASQQLLVGAGGGRVLRGACLGTPPPPREFLAAERAGLPGKAAGSEGGGAPNTARAADNDGGQMRVGDVTSLSVCPLHPNAWLAGHSCGSVALFATARSRPALLWRQLRAAPVLAVRWVPARPCAFLVLHADGALLALDLARDPRRPAAVVDLAQQQQASAPGGAPCCMEVLASSRSGSSSSGGASVAAAAAETAACMVAVGHAGGRAAVYRLADEWAGSRSSGGAADELSMLTALLAGC
ncbi:hypothetical protein HT031_003312 [Scenedesmus sp. PABB004]|nr:hypothetical protein HT031_003312 [Scenedesmus sp. PABB004]